MRVPEFTVRPRYRATLALHAHDIITTLLQNRLWFGQEGPLSKVVLLIISLLIFILVQVGALPFVLIALPVVPVISTLYIYFLLLLPFLWLRSREEIPVVWKAAALTLPVVVGVGV